MTYFEKIDKEFMTRFNGFRRAVLDFEAFRTLWARKVTSRNMDVADLEEGQSCAIIDLLNAAENIRKHIGLKWVTVLPGDGEMPDGVYLGERHGKSITAIEIVDGQCLVAGEVIGSPEGLINDGWRLDGPVRSSVLR